MPFIDGYRRLMNKDYKRPKPPHEYRIERFSVDDLSEDDVDWIDDMFDTFDSDDEFEETPVPW